ncbi:UDP-N-acetylmuramoyl-L-alanyl-D-glutamate--2,6-diaminopimelate ligase [Falsochrobactrum shanghaiense]|uniref:UDP-N-acetylmuramoyl-L-alanyl-D-glutamate--2,6-diaminopimelate ligase n=1 Tax=Falsochrobactrum shanghaiense TaxID=2201899 RepID=A0A316J7A0_9HYPH|nr:UDP-N-acetylmuramoyl-L-alanyl-D-glutamate--2,6-diaminopimelate ligase [Falsochrobactrum shanghaiense]PWL17008.1 UDP-N-acetylmuramoyl-L-alanyl-D-glutamate--2,6-diaminopimelate ligase [Falsochrobactrum shanghaiense]
MTMKLKEIALFKELTTGTAGEVEITGVTSDSRKVERGFLFAALKGVKADGAAFAADAVQRGAVAIIAGKDTLINNVPVPVLHVDDPRHGLAIAAAQFYGRQPEVMVAVTGTSGKTSVASFTRQIWAYAGFPAANIGTTGVFSPTRSDYNSLTTPDPVELQRVLAVLADEGVTHTAMEASSHGLDQRRLDGVKLTAGAFTNLGRDHMDYHATIEEYLGAKMRLFDTLLPKGSPVIIFADDHYSPQAIAAAQAAGCAVKTVGRKGDFIALKRVEHERFRQHVEVRINDEIYEVELPLAGDFQVANALVAAGLAMVTGVPAAAAMRALERLKGAPGRLDLVGATEEGAPVYVDYAHKPEALENVLTSVRPFTTGRVIVVFGCGGDRDKGKRPIMGEIASRLADVTIVTDDNPRSETPAQIRSEIMAAAPGAMEIGDRREAIFTAVSMMMPGDTLVVAGKGHEEGQTVGSITLPFSDHKAVAAALAARLEEHKE